MPVTTETLDLIAKNAARNCFYVADEFQTFDDFLRRIRRAVQAAYDLGLSEGESRVER